jgi:catechol 2,3-dioxygenase
MVIRPQLRHLGIYVSDIERMERFYSAVFGLVVSDRGTVKRLGNRSIVFLSAAPDAHHQLVLIGGKDPAGGPSVVNQISFQLQSLAELREIARRLERAGVSGITPIDHGNAWSVYSADPEGNGLEAYVDSPWHVAQPHGRPLDLAKTDEEILAATQAAVRADPTFCDRPSWIDAMRKRLA